MADPLIGGLTSSLGVTENQAMGGVGSVLTLAQEKLAKGEFDQVAKVIPGSSKYLDMAKSLGAVTGTARQQVWPQQCAYAAGHFPHHLCEVRPGGDGLCRARPAAPT